MINKLLENLGLSHREALVYLALLEHGTASAFGVSKTINQNHATVYAVLKNLQQKGLVSKYELKNTTHFSASEPLYLNKLIEKKRRELDAQELELKKHFSELSAIYNLSQKKPRVRLYLGKEGIKDLENDADELDQKNIPIIYAFTPIDVQEEYVPLASVADRRVQRNQKLKLIYTHKKGVQGLTNLKILREARFLPRDQFPFNASISISPDHSIRIYSYKNGFIGIWIDSPEIANTLKTIFDVCWQVAKKE